MVTSLSPVEMWPLVTIARTAASNYGRALLSFDLGTFVTGAYQAGKGAGYAVAVLYYLLRALWTHGRAGSGLRVLSTLLSNLVIAIVALVANVVVLAGPPYLLWELLFAADPVVLPDIVVFGFRTLLDIAITIGSILLIALIAWFFIEEFTPGRNQVFELDDLHQNSATNQHQNTRTRRRTMEGDQIQSKLSEVERELKDNR